MFYLFGVMCLLALGHSVYIAKEECPTNEEYLLCGSLCAANCSSPAGACGDDCAEGCFCMTGFLRDANGTCVAMDQCPGATQVCGENEELVSCATVCPATCAVPEPEVCGVACGMGCFCRDGFYRDEETNKCVTMDNCPAQECFNANEVYDICNASCQPSCSDPEPICTKLCSGGCICAPGLLRGPNGDCVSVDRCGNVTDTSVLTKYLNAINNILHLTTETTE